MSGRFPFDLSAGRTPAQNLTAQVRAALGLSPATLDEYSQAIKQQQQQQQQQQELQQQQDRQRDLQLRHLILQEQVDQQLQDQIQALNKHLHEYPGDIAAQYQSLVLTDQLNRRRDQVAQAQLQYQQELRRHQLVELTTPDQQPATPARTVPLLGLSTTEQLEALAQLNVLNQLASEQRGHQQQQRDREQQHQQQLKEAVAAATAKPRARAYSTDNDVESSSRRSPIPGKRKQDDLEHLKMAARQKPDHSPKPPKRTKGVTSPQPQAEIAATVMGAKSLSPRTKALKEALVASTEADLQSLALQMLQASRPVSSKSSFLKKKERKKKDPPAKLAKLLSKALPINHATSTQDSIGEASAANAEPQPHDLYLKTILAGTADLATALPIPVIPKGTLDDLTLAATEMDKVDEAVSIMTQLVNVEWPDSDDEDEKLQTSPKADSVAVLQDEEEEIRVSTNPDECIDLPGFHSALPLLPEEPVLEEDILNVVKEVVDEINKDNDSPPKKKSPIATNSIATTPKQPAATSVKMSNVLEYPYPIDTWWPSINGMRRERRQIGETSDEDDFEEGAQVGTELPLFRANEQKIRHRLANLVEPGVLEKLSHCRIHRVRTKRKKNSTAPELVYCFQVTEIYPNDSLVNCSQCGTWRHAACGGHFEPVSTRDCAKVPFVAVCEQCHQEDQYLKDYPVGAQYLERQRMEWLRRALATSAVMRHASFSKHGGTYKWPLGSVTATHIGGHTRSVHARHDKAEKQWADMATRLSRGYGYRPKDRVRSRTKELERLLVSVEDAEGYTDRHNMMLFLRRDVNRDQPVGYSKRPRNIFDPADDLLHADHDSTRDDHVNSIGGKEESESILDTKPRGGTLCARSGCRYQHRFDSIFCSDACGVNVLEYELLRTLQDASEIHPSVLRT